MAGEDIVMFRQGELRRLHVIRKVLERGIKQVMAAKILSLSCRQIQRLVQRVKEEGDRGVVHKSRGRPSNRRLADRVKDRAIKLYRKRLAATEKIPNMAIVVPKGIGREMIIQGNSSPQSTDHGWKG